MIGSIIALVGSFVEPMFDYVLLFLFALAFVATVPCLIRDLLGRIG